MTEPEDRLYLMSKVAVGACIVALAVVIGLGVQVVPPRFWFVVIVLGGGAIWWCAHQHQAMLNARAKREAAERVKNKPSGPKRLEDFEK